MKLPGPSLSDIQHVVPAMQPAWVRIVECFVTEDQSDRFKEWQDLVLPVLAYGTLPGGVGAYLVNYDSDGPVWFTLPPNSRDIKIIHSVGIMPERGTEVPGFTDEHTYLPEMSDFIDPLWWLL